MKEFTSEWSSQDVNFIESHCIIFLGALKHLGAAPARTATVLEKRLKLEVERQYPTVSFLGQKPRRHTHPTNPVRTTSTGSNRRAYSESHSHSSIINHEVYKSDGHEKIISEQHKHDSKLTEAVDNYFQPGLEEQRDNGKSSEPTFKGRSTSSSTDWDELVAGQKHTGLPGTLSMSRCVNKSGFQTTNAFTADPKSESASSKFHKPPVPCEGSSTQSLSDQSGMHSIHSATHSGFPPPHDALLDNQSSLKLLVSLSQEQYRAEREENLN